MTSDPWASPDATAPQPAEFSASAFALLLDDFQKIRLPLASDTAHAAAERRREEVSALIEGHISDARWRALMHQAREAAEQGEREQLLLRFPARACTDEGRAIIEQEPSWPGTLTAEAAAVYRHWQQDLQPRGFRIAARIVDYPGGLPGEAALFLIW